jgi:arylsulfatase A-like enzyme
MADDLGYGDLSGYGRPDYQTPQLDRLSAQGTRFTQAYAIAPLCTPTRVGFMTGRYPSRHPVGLREPLTGFGEDLLLGLEASHPTVSSLLKSAGYTNALFGKWHLGVKPEFQPDKHGFDEFFGPLSGAVDYIAHRNEAGEPDLYENGKAVHVDGYLTDLVIDRAVRFIGKRPEPFFLSLQGTSPHWPWQRRGDEPYAPGQSLRGPGPADRYPDMVRILDEGVGRVLAELQASGLAERTLVIFTADNGGERFSNMGGLARRKGSVWEGGIRVPTFVRWPAVIPAGVSTTQVATTLDWSATILSVAQAAASSSHPLDGIDLLPILTGQTPMEERTIFWRRVGPMNADTTAEARARLRESAVRSGNWKYNKDANGEYLYDLAVDPGERIDVKESESQRFARLKEAYAKWEAQMLPIPAL